MLPLISIVIPCYNLENKIEKCIQSLLAQSYKNIEIIIINDGSTDNSLCVIQKLSEEDSRIRYYSHENRGVSYSRNFGIDVSKGEYLMFVDGDDYLSPNYIEHFINVLSSETDLIIGGITFRHSNYDTVVSGIKFSCDHNEFFKKYYTSKKNHIWPS